MLAILYDAIWLIQQKDRTRARRGRALAAEALHWIELRGYSHSTFSFDAVCEALNLDPHALRARLLRGDVDLSRHSREAGSRHAVRAGFIERTGREWRQRLACEY